MKKIRITTILFFHLHGGGYANTKKLNFHDISEKKYENTTYNDYEKQYLDIEHSKWLNEHPKCTYNKKKSNHLQKQRFEILMYYFHSDNKTENEWAKQRITFELAPFIKSRVSNKNIHKEDNYAEVNQETYTIIFENIKTLDPIRFKASTWASGLVNTASMHTFADNKGLKRTHGIHLKAYLEAKSKLAEKGLTNPGMAELISESGLNVSDLEYAIAESKVLGNALTLDNLTDEPYLPDYDNIYLNVLHDTILKNLEQMGEIYKAIICYSYGFKYGDGKYEGIELCAKQISKILTESGHKISEANVRKYKQKAINLICDSPEIASWTESKEKSYDHTHSIGKKDITTLFKEFLSDDDEHIIEGKKLEEDEESDDIF